jgi:hypothetical protein
MPLLAPAQVGTFRPTADVPEPFAPRMSEEAREKASRRQRVIIGEAPPDVAMGGRTTSYVEAPQTSQGQFVAPVPREVEQAEAVQQRSPTKSHNRANLSNGAEQSPTLQQTEQRRSLTAAVEKNGASAPKPMAVEIPDPKTVAAKGGDAKSPKTPRLVSNPEGLNGLTSASIRGPEDFDMFVQGADTVKYTLTPDTVRDTPAAVNGSRSANNTTVVKTNGAQPMVLRGLPTDEDAAPPSRDTRAGRSQTTKLATSAATTAGADDVEEERYQSSKRRSISKPPPRNTSTHRKSGLMAREPRVQTESTRDFADFIRSTGPETEKSVYPILANVSQTSLHSLRSAHIHGAAASRSSSPNGERTRSFTRNSLTSSDVPPVPAIPSKPKSNMQPRGAKATTQGSADLIDFIRSGPQEDGTHRISRTVAPFRTTMDSDQLRDFDGRESAERSWESRKTYSTTPTQITSSRSSHRTSVNSRSALLNGHSNNMPAITQPAYSGQPSSLSSRNVSRGSTLRQNEPRRKQTRSKDPYSMDFLDDDDDDDYMDDLTSLPARGRREESLVDFLNNNEPPRNNDPVPVVGPDSQAFKNAAARVKAGNTNGGQFVHTSADTRPKSILSSGQATPVQKLQARGGVKDIAANSNTQELVDFFKSGPSEDPDGAPAPTVGRSNKKGEEKLKKKSGGGGGFFGRSFKRKT